MMSRFIELENAIKATVAILDINLSTLSPNDWKICQVLKAFEEVEKSI